MGAVKLRLQLQSRPHPSRRGTLGRSSPGDLEVLFQEDDPFNPLHSFMSLMSPSTPLSSHSTLAVQALLLFPTQGTHSCLGTLAPALPSTLWPLPSPLPLLSLLPCHSPSASMAPMSPSLGLVSLQGKLPPPLLT